MDDAQNTRWTLRRFTSFDAMKAEEYAYWQSRPAHERIAAISEITTEAYRMKEPAINVSRLQRTLVRIERGAG